MGHLIDDLLQFSRLGRKSMSSGRVDLTEVARQVVEEVRNAYPDRTVDVTIDTLPPARGDAAMLRQALYNLVDNAFKFTRHQASARVAIGHHVREGDTVYYVRDNGAGFDMRYVNKVFGVFQRLHRAEEFPGTGVGLALAQRIVLRHGGRIWADAAVGEGATFSFILPRAE
jgi:light-regulated signal transduction histidine kinase (bacteriophytochrome)